jgi:peptidoglycan/LPS O-acetylase OafA/YrhL
MGIFKSIKSILFSEISSIPPYLKNRDASLNGLRAVAISLVLLSHFRINKTIAEYGIKLNGHVGVLIFFVLSGFLITTGLLKQKIINGKLSLSDFYIKRFLRIFPLVYIFLAVIVLLNIYKPVTNLKDLFYCFFFIKNFPLQNMPFTAHLWTLAVEIQFYAIFPLLMALNVNRTLFISFLLIIIFPCISILSLYVPGFESDYLPLQWGIKFVNYFFWKGPLFILIGCTASAFIFKNGSSIEKISRNYFLSFFLLVLAIALCTQTLPIYYKYVSEYLSAILISAVIILCVQSKNFLSKLLSNKIMVKIGILSYSLFIWQQIIAAKYYFWIPGLRELNTLPSLAMTVIRFALLFPIAYLSYKYLEMPFLRLKERFR